MHERDKTRIAVLVCLAAPLLQAGVNATLAEEPDIELVNAELISVHRKIDVVIADSFTATKLAEGRRDFSPGHGLESARILVITSQVREHAILMALEHGIHGFLLTTSPVHDLLASISALACGGNYMCAPVLRQLAQVAERDMLTGREGEVLQLLAKGQSNKSIARGLDIAVGTVKTHVQSIMSKLDAGCRTEAVSVAIERGLVELPESLLRHIKPHAFAAAWQASAQPELVQA